MRAFAFTPVEINELFEVLRAETLPRVGPVRVAIDAARSESDPTKLQPARELFHRTAGTATLVGLPGLARLTRLGEQVALLGLEGEAKLSPKLCAMLGSVLDAIETDLSTLPEGTQKVVAPVVAASEESTKGRVALASDENVSAKLLLKFLEEAGFEPTRYPLAAAARRLPDCDVLLLDMPTSENGFPAMERLVTAAVDARLPVLLTAKPDPKNEVLAAQTARVTVFLPKPVVPEDLVQAARTQIERRRAAKAARSRAVTSGGMPALPRAETRALKVMVVDDSRVIRGVVREALAEVGLIAIEAEDGVEALRLFEAERPDAVISDVQMPGLDGAQLTKVLRERGGDQRIPIVVLSALDDERSRAAGLAAGADAYLVKNVIDGPALLKALKNAGLPI